MANITMNMSARMNTNLDVKEEPTREVVIVKDKKKPLMKGVMVEVDAR